MKKARYEKAARAAAKLIVQLGIDRLPVDPFWIIEQLDNCEAMDYDEFGSLRGLSAKDVARMSRSHDGCAAFDGKRYLVLYNTDPYMIVEPKRIRWTIMHEIGHIMLDHHVDFHDPSDEVSEILEIEANHFAYHVLAPPIILNAIKVKAVEEIAASCALSTSAAANRLMHLQRWKRRGRVNSYWLPILHQFCDYVKQRKCLFCGAHFTSDPGKHCPICGETHLVWGDGEMFYNDGFQVNENGKAMICPRCKNEEIYDDDDHDYCQICGTYLINECAATYLETDTGFRHLQQSCGRPVAGNARFCPNCGNVTTFFERGLLEPWEEAQKKLAEQDEGPGIHLAAVSSMKGSK